MNSWQAISIVMVLIGALFMCASIILSIKTNKDIPPTYQSSWKILAGLMTFFLIGYLTFAVIQIKQLPFSIEMITGIVFLAGALFVFLMIRLTRNTIAKIIESENLLRKAKEELEIRVDQRTRDLQKTLANLGHEVTARKKASKALADAYGELAQILNSAADGIRVIDKNYIVLRVNRTFTQMMDLSDEDIIGLPCHQVIGSPSCNTPACPVSRILNGETRVELEREVSSRNGRNIPCLITAYPYHDAEGALVGVVESFRDISERKEMENRLKEMSVTDELTGLLNRRGFLDMAGNQLILAERLNKELFLLYMDLDKMKWINDNLGHAAGDQALVEAADALKSTFRKTDVIGIGRLGGDEFAVLMLSEPGTTCDHPVVSRLQEHLDEINREPGRAYELSMSVGMVTYSFDAPCSIDELLARGDEAMYQCKRKKKKQENGE
ncbi:MAG: diguanylate cyclase [Pseudomonadota bacterium]